jgi:hypothetical protein
MKDRLRTARVSIGALVAVPVLVAASCSTNVGNSPANTGSQTSGAANTPPVATQTPTPPPAPVTMSGHGDSVITVPSPYSNQPTLVAAKNSGSANFAVKSLASDNSEEELLVNTIGNFSGTEAMDFDGSSPAAKLQITAGDGTWSLKFSDPSGAPSFGASTSGDGDAVVAYTGSSGTAAFTNKGTSNFVVMQFDMLGSSGNLMVNEIGNYSGSVPIDSGGLLVITSDGHWTVSVSS